MSEEGQGDGYARRHADRVLPAREGEVAQSAGPQFANCGPTLSFRDEFMSNGAKMPVGRPRTMRQHKTQRLWYNCVHSEHNKGHKA